MKRVLTSLPRRGLAIGCAAAAALVGVVAAVYYHRLGLTLSHYDARGHLVVARRIIDSITPGWQQIGAVWLPLPHLLDFLPVQIDSFYRTGASAVAISVAAFAVAAGSIAWIAAIATDSTAAGVVAAAVFSLNPNVVYLQSTPMSEPLLIASTTLAIALLIAWCAAPPSAPCTRTLRAGAVGTAFALACLTRYEAWPITAAALILALCVARREREWTAAIRDVSRIAIYPAAAIVAFIVFSRIVVGQWFVSSGFFVPENKALGNPVLAAAEICWGARNLGGALLMIVAAGGLAALVARAVASRGRTAGASVIATALVAAAALPWAAFFKGHPFRIRYMVPLIAAEAIGVGTAVGVTARFRAAAVVAALAIVAIELRPFDVRAPMVIEAQWEQPNAAPRRAVTAYLRAAYHGETIMASMGSLGHYMQEASTDGFAIRDFLHEGNGDIWLAALDGPRPFVGWILIEEKASGGDMLAKIARKNPRFLDGFVRVREGGGLVLYRRQ